MNTKELILEKTLKLMIEKQNPIISIKEIKETTGIATGGIYYYFSSKEEIYDEITKKYFLNYAKFDIDKLKQINGNTKEKIHDILFEIIKQKQTGIKVKSINEEIDYRSILHILTANGCSYENSLNFYHSIVNELKEFLTEIIEEGQKNREITQVFSSKDIAESLIIMYLGIQYKWELYYIDNMISDFEDNFNMEWEKIRFKE